MAFRSLESTKKVIRTSRSFDGGTTWDTAAEVQQNEIQFDDIDEPTSVVQLTTGRLLVAFRNHAKDGATGAFTYFRITVYRSDDSGTTWQYHSHCYERDATVDPNAIWEPVLRMASGNILQCYFSEETSKTSLSDATVDQNIALHQSNDDGVTWAYVTTPVGIAAGNIINGMSGVAAIDDAAGKLMSVTRIQSRLLKNPCPGP